MRFGKEAARQNETEKKTKAGARTQKGAAGRAEGREQNTFEHHTPFEHICWEKHVFGITFRDSDLGRFNIVNLAHTRSPEMPGSRLSTHFT